MPWQPQQQDRKKTLTLVLVLHAGLGLALWHGLAGEPLRRASESLTTYNVALPEPPLTPPDPSRDRAAAKEREAGATDLEAQAAAIVRPAPQVRLPVPPNLRTADEASPVAGLASSAGAGREAGQGRGAGSGGDGTGGSGSGGSGTGAGGPDSQAHLISGNLSRGDYRRIRSFGAPRGQAVLAIEVGPEGRLTRCLPLSSSGNPELDFELCRLLARTQWEPARNRDGEPVAVALRYVANWDRD